MKQKLLISSEAATDSNCVLCSITMRVLYLTMNPNRASTTVPTEGWFRLLPDRGLEPVLVSHAVGKFHHWAADLGVPAYHVTLPRPSKRWPIPLVRALWKLKSIVKRHNIELIHCNEQDIYPVGQYLARLCHLPVVVSVHFTMLRNYCTWAFSGRRRPARMFFLSRGSREACRDGMQGVLSEDRWRLMPNGLDLENFRPDAGLRTEYRRRYGVQENLTVGVACALRPRKQLEHLFAAVAKIPFTNIRVVVAGDAIPGDEEYAQELLADARRKLGDRLIFLGHLEELRGFYNALDLFVNTSKEEACSISIIESLACGCPVVGYPSKSVDEQVLPGGGQIVEQDNVEFLTAALTEWLSDAERLKLARGGARLRAETDYDIKKLSEYLWDEYQAVLDESRQTTKRSVVSTVSCF